jgi:hypothetical protein
MYGRDQDSGSAGVQKRSADPPRGEHVTMIQSTSTTEQADDPRASDPAKDRTEIRELLQNWVIWRDAGEWERFATVWHDDGRMVATWFRASAAEFIEGCRKGFEAGVISLHSLGGISIEVQGTRAVSQSKMQILQRGSLDGIEVDVICMGRFVDALEKRDGRWGIVLRQPVYELDHMIPVDPASKPKLDSDILNKFPIGYRNLAYLQTRMGFNVDPSLPGTRGKEIEHLMSRMARWLSGDNPECLDA